MRALKKASSSKKTHRCKGAPYYAAFSTLRFLKSSSASRTCASQPLSPSLKPLLSPFQTVPSLVPQCSQSMTCWIENSHSLWQICDVNTGKALVNDCYRPASKLKLDEDVNQTLVSWKVLENDFSLALMTTARRVKPGSYRFLRLRDTLSNRLKSRCQRTEGVAPARKKRTSIKRPSKRSGESSKFSCPKGMRISTSLPSL